MIRTEVVITIEHKVSDNSWQSFPFKGTDSEVNQLLLSEKQKPTFLKWSVVEAKVIVLIQ